MTKAELIRKLAKKAGVYDSDAKIFFEIFLQQTSSILNPGEAVSIKNYGFFQLRKGKIKGSASTFKNENDETFYPDLIVYCPPDKSYDDKDEMLIFNIPIKIESEYNPLDAYFSLSIGKPVIPLHGVKSTEFFIPPTGNELRRLLESKVDNILAHSDLVKNYIKGNEFLQITPDIYSIEQFELNLNEHSVDQSRRAHPDILTDPESIAWDFGEDILKQIEEDSILDIERDEVITHEPVNENVSWDFGDEYYGEVQEELVPEANEVEYSQDIDKQEEAEVFKEEEHDEIENIEKFQRVKSLTKEYTGKAEGGSVSRSGEDLSWSFGPDSEDGNVTPGDESNLYNKYDGPLTDKNGYTEVKNKRRTYDDELAGNERKKLNSLIKEELEVVDEIEDSDAVTDFYKDDAGTIHRKQTESFESLPEEEDYGKRKSTPVFFISISVIVLVGAALFIFITKGNLFKKQESRSQAESVIISSPSVTINRSFEIPVTYPYSKTDSVTSINLPVKDSVIKVQQQIINKKEESTPAVSLSTGSRIVDASSQSGVKIKENLYKEGDTYTVQVSAWKSKVKAEGEVAKLRNKRLNAFVQQVEIPGRGTWYRVKIGKLKTQAEAEKYLY